MRSHPSELGNRGKKIEPVARNRALAVSFAVNAAIEPLERRLMMSTVIVNTTADSIDTKGSGIVSLRDAVNTADSSHSQTTITFDPTVFATPQTIILGGTYLDLTGSHNVTITGPAVGVAVSGAGQSGVLVDQSTGASVNISNMTFTNGSANSGGGIMHTGSDTLTLTNVTVSYNDATYYGGGGIYNTGSLVIDGCTIINNAVVGANDVYGSGGGIENAEGTLTLVDSTVSGNSIQSASDYGGAGIENYYGTATILSSTVSGNTNYANLSGGAVVNAPGGGIFSNNVLTITNSTIAGNTGSSGGGVYVSGTVTLSDSTISGNTGANGGGLYLYGSGGTIQNSVISGNTSMPSGSSPDVATAINNNVSSSGHNFIGKSDGSTGWLATDIVGTIASPRDAKLGALANNGGTTFTMLPQPGGPLIDAGSNALIPTGIITDQRGFARIYNGTVDIGAVETVPLQSSPPSITSPNSVIFPIGSPDSFIITAAGYPTPTLSETGTLPTGVTFADNGNGTATLAGTAATGSASSYSFTITATNGDLPNATQKFTLQTTSVNYWTNASGGDWDTPGNWSIDQIPTATEDVVINLPGDFTVTHSLNDTDSAHSIVSNHPFNLSGGSLNVTTTVEVDSTFTISGGTLINATVLPGSNGSSMVVSAGSGSTLSGVTLVSNLNVSQGSVLSVTNGLNLSNGAVLNLAETDNGYGDNIVYFDGSQTLGGSGKVVMPDNDFSYGYIGSDVAGSMLTIAPNVTISGSGQLGNDDLTLIDEGTIAADDSTGSTLILGNTVSVVGQGMISSYAADDILVLGSVLGSTTNMGGWALAGSVTFDGSGTTAAPQLLEAMSNDLGATTAGFQGNFDYPKLALENNTDVELVDQYQNIAGATTSNAVYANSLAVPKGSTLNLNGLHLYTRSLNVLGTVTGGMVTLVSGTPLPDLSPQNISAAAASTGIVTVAWNDVNGGTSNVINSFTDQVQLIDVTAGNIVLGTTTAYYNQSVNGPLVDNNGSYPQAVNFSLVNYSGYSAFHAGDSLTATITVDVDENIQELTKANNAASVTVTQAPAPNLTVTSLSVSGDSTGNVNINWSDKNTGLGPVTENYYDGVVVTDAATGAQVYSGYASVGAAGSPITSGASAPQTLSFQLPDGYVSTDLLKILVTADLENYIYETSEADNTASTTTTAPLASYPDLSVMGLTGSENVSGVVTVNWLDSNTNGAAAVTGSFTDLVIVTDARTGMNLSTGTLGYNPTSSGVIAAGAFASRSDALQLPQGTPVADGLSVTVIINYYGNVFESNSSNDSATATVAKVAVADLAVQNLTVTPINPTSGGTITINWTDANVGAGSTAGSWNDQVTVVNQTTGQTIFSQPVNYNSGLASNGDIAAGGSRARSVSLTLPNYNAGAGTLQVTVTVNASGSVFESNLTNNTAAATVVSALSLYSALTVSSVNGPASANLGQPVSVIYTVTNTGTATASGPWLDELFISGYSNGSNAIAVTTSEFNGILTPGQAIQRSVTMTLPTDLTGTSYYYVVEADSTSVLNQLNRTGDTAVSATALSIPPTLLLSLADSTVPKSAGADATTGTVTRTGSLTDPLTVTLIDRNTSDTTAPPTITIPAGQSAATFTIGTIDDGLVDGNQAVTFTASAAGYIGGNAALTVQETDVPTLTLTINNTTFSENAGISAATATLTRNADLNTPLVVSLASSNIQKVTVPVTVVIPAGQTTASFALTAVNDDRVEGPASVTISATCNGFSTANQTVAVTEANAPVLGLALSNQTVSEAAGNSATIGTITIPTALAGSLDIALASSDTTAATVPALVVIPAGKTSVTFTIAAVDDGLDDASKTATITAEVETAAGVVLTQGRASAGLIVINADGPALSVAFAASTVNRGSSTTATVTRNTNTNAALVVNLSSSNASKATVPQTVTIPAGQASATFTVTTLDDHMPDGVQQVQINASASSFAPAIVPLGITDVDLPDLVVSNVTAPASGYDNSTINISWTVINSGQYPASGSWLDEVYLDLVGGAPSTTPADSIAFNGVLNAGKSYTQTDALQDPSTVGQYTVRVVTDSNQNVEELNFANNTASSGSLNDQALYHATVSATVTTASTGTSIPLSGVATLTSNGKPAADVPVAVQIMVAGTTRTLIATTNSNGQYNINFQPLKNEAGQYTVSADDPGVANPTVQARFQILGMTATPASGTISLVPNTPSTGQITLTNLTAIALNGISATSSGGPAGLVVQLTPPTQISGNGTGTLSYSITATSNQAANGVVTIHLTTSQGAVLTILLSVSVVPLTPQLETNPGSLNSGMLVGSQTILSFVVTNNGGAPSGPLQVSIPSGADSYMALGSAAAISSLAPGGSSTVTIELDPAATLALEQYSGTIAVGNSQTSISVPFTLQAVSSAVGSVNVLVDDDYTFEESGAPHVQGATVSLLNPYDNTQVVATGLTDGTGAITFSNVPAGPYELQVSAPGHSTYQSSYPVVPGIANNDEIFIARQFVSYTFTVQQTTIQDTYQIQLQTTFETNVPAPVVTMSAPATIPTLIPGQSGTFNITLTNHGLIAADQVTLNLPTDPGYTFSALASDIGTLPANSSVTVPVTVTRNWINSVNTSTGTSTLTTEVEVPGEVGNHVGSTLYVDYSNTGTAPISAPLLVLTANQETGTFNGHPYYASPGALMTLNSALQSSGLDTANIPSGYSNSVEVLASGATAGVLEPGETIRIPVYYAGWQNGMWNDAAPAVDFAIQVIQANDSEPMNWAGETAATVTREETTYSHYLNGVYYADQVFQYNSSANYPINVLWVNGTPPTWDQIIKQFEAQNPLPSWPYDSGNIAVDLPFLRNDDPGVLQSRPSAIPEQAWNIIADNLQSSVGATLGDYVRSMDNEAAYLGKIGEDATDAGSLWGLEVQQANNSLNPLAPYLASATDDSVSTPGSLSLSFSRSYGESISARDTIGPLGMGWTDSWQTSASIGSNGVVTISEPGGAQRNFDPSSTVAGAYTSVLGDTGTLSADGSGGYLLTESDGIATDYTAAGLLNFMQDPNGNRITASYAHGKLTSLTSSTGQYVQIGYNAAGLIASLTDSSGQVTNYSYDSTNTYLISVTSYNGQTSNYSYDTTAGDAAINALKTITIPGGTHQYFSYNSTGQLTEIYEDGGADPETFGYNEGEVSITDGTEETSDLYYNENGQVGESVDPLGNPTYYSYNGTYNLVKVTDAAGQSETYTYNNADEVTSATDFLGNTTSYSYGGPDNNLTSMTDANGNRTQYSYDSSGDLLSTTYADGTSSSTTFNPLGEATSFINQNGQPIDYTYNTAGQVTQESFSDGTKYTYTYDSHGNLLTATDSTGTTTFTYNPSTQFLTEVAYPNGTWLKFTYNAAGQRTQMVDQTGFTTNYIYSSNAVLYQLTDANGSVIVTYTYDADGRLSEKVNGNATYTTYQYDADGNVLKLINYAPGGTMNSYFYYTYNALGLETTEDTNDGNWTYAYDADGQLTDAVFASTNSSVPNQNLVYNYDAMGNRTSTVINGVTTVYTVNDMNEYASVGGVAYSYDADGNLLSDGSDQYTYDPLNDVLTEAGRTGDVDFTYNALGQQVSSENSGELTQYQIDPATIGNVVATLNAQGSVLSHFTYGLGLSAQVQGVGGASYFFDFDQLGSASGVSGATGSYVNSATYLPFGASEIISAGIATPFGFVGQWGVQAGEGSTDSMGARKYSPINGRFLSTDPLGLAGGSGNLFAYVGNSPLAGIDPLGESGFKPPLSPPPVEVQTPRTPADVGPGAAALGDVFGMLNWFGDVWNPKPLPFPPPQDPKDPCSNQPCVKPNTAPPGYQPEPSFHPYDPLLQDPIDQYGARYGYPKQPVTPYTGPFPDPVPGPTPLPPTTPGGTPGGDTPGGGSCTLAATADYSHDCGGNVVTDTAYCAFGVPGRDCTAQGVQDALTLLNSGTGTSSSSNNSSGTNTGSSNNPTGGNGTPPTTQTNVDCNPALNNINTAASTASADGGDPPVNTAPLITGSDEAADAAGPGANSSPVAFIATMLGDLGLINGDVGNASYSSSDLAQVAGTIATYDQVEADLAGLFQLAGGSGASLGIAGDITQLQQIDAEMKLVSAAENLLFGGDANWLGTKQESTLQQWMTAFYADIQTSSDTGAVISMAEQAQLLATVLPSSVTISEATEFIDRWNLTVQYWDQGIFTSGQVPAGQSADFLDLGAIQTAFNSALVAEQQSQAAGYTDPLAQVEASLAQLQKDISQIGVCATVKLQIDQTAALTRSAFKGTLSLSNSEGTGALTNVVMNITITDSEGNPANGEFYVSSPAYSGAFSVVNGNATLPDYASGSITFTFIPADTAASSSATLYDIGGTIAFTDPSGGNVSIAVFPTTITVYPQAELKLNYFLQQDVVGEDPLNPNVAVTPEPAVLGLLVTNAGLGAADNLSIATGQPQIIENLKGLDDTFTIVGTQVGAQQLSPSLTVDFGDVEPGQTADADFLLESQLQGVFTNFTASFTHSDALGGMETSLIDSVTTHTLIHAGVFDYDDNSGEVDYLAEDNANPGNLPDTIYFSDGTTAPVNIATGAASASSIVADSYTVTANVTSGWDYIQLPDPAGAGFTVYKVMRSDGTVIPVSDQAWTTDRTFDAAGNSTVDYELHILDDNSTGSYTVYYKPNTVTAPQVSSIQQVTSPQSGAVSSLQVAFNEPINAATFTTQDLSLTLNGTAVPITSAVTITPSGSNTFAIAGLSALTAGDGNYVFTVNAATVDDPFGDVGSGSLSTAWSTGTNVPVVVSVGAGNPAQRNTPVSSVQVVLSEPINPATFTYISLTLTLNGGTTNLITPSVTVTSLSSTTFEVGGLGGLTGADGTYLLTVNASGLVDASGNTGVGFATLSWNVNTKGPAIASLQAVTQSPRNTVVPTLDVTFSEPINPATFSDQNIAFSKNGGANLINSSVTITPIGTSGTEFEIGNFENLVAPIDGTYTFTVNAAGVQDVTGNIGSGSASDTWVLATAAPDAPFNLMISPAVGTAVGGVTYTNTANITLTGNVDASGLTVEVYDGLSIELATAVVTGETFSATLSLSAGAHDLRVYAVDDSANVSASTYDSIFVDEIAPTAIFAPVSQATTQSAVTSAQFIFSNPINAATLTYQDFTLTLNGGPNLINSSVTVRSISGNTYEIDGLQALNSQAGQYVLTLNMSSVQDLAGNAGEGSPTVSWQVAQPTLALSGSASSTYYLELDADGKHVDVWDSSNAGGNVSQSVLLSGIQSVTLNGTAGGATVIVNFANGDPLPSGGFSFNGQAGANNTLEIIGTTGNDAVTIDTDTVTESAAFGSATMNYSNVSAITFSGGTGNDALTQSAQPGSGAVVSFLNSTSNDILNVDGGAYTIAAAAAGSSIQELLLGGVSIGSGAKLILAAANGQANRTVLVLNTLSIASAGGNWTGSLDLSDNDLVIQDGSLAEITSAIKSGFNPAGGGDWIGAGIVSSAAADDSAHLTALGVLLNNNGIGGALYGGGAALGVFDGVSPAVNAILVKYTYYGDADLNGVVDGSDYGRIDSGLLDHLGGWSNGDFNYDGQVNSSDYTLIDNAFNMQGSRLNRISPDLTLPAAPALTYDGTSDVTSWVIPSLTGTAGGPVPTGVVTIKYYSASGATLASPPILPGIYTVVASFAGDAFYAASLSNAVTFTIGRAVPTVTLAAGPSNIRYDGTTDVTNWVKATVAGISGAATPTGTTSILYYSGTSATGTPLSSSPINAGTYTVIASYSGDSNYSASLSNQITFNISAATGALPLALTGTAFYLKLDPDGLHLDIWDSSGDSGSPAQSVLLSMVSSIAVDGVIGGTTLSVDFSAGDPLVPSGLNFNGLAQAANLLKVIDSGDNSAASYTVSASEVQVGVPTGSALLDYANTAAINIYAGLGPETITQNAQPGGGATALSYLNTTASDNLIVNSGTFNIAAAPAGTGITAVTLGNVSIEAGAIVTVVQPEFHADRHVLVLSSLFLAGATNAWLAQLNMSGNDLIVHNGNLSQLSNQIASGYSYGALNGQGITSSTAAADPSHLTALGVELNTNATNQPLFGSGTALGLFDGQNPSVTDVLIKYTYYGDADLNGVVDGSDYSRIDNGYLNHLSGWYNGDFDCNGVINASDYTLADNAFNTQGSSLSDSGLTIPAGNSVTIPVSTSGHTVRLISDLNIAGTRGAWTGRLDLTNNDADIIDGSLVTLTNQVAEGYDDGAWQGEGITSSTAGNDSSHLTAVAVIQNNQSGSPIFSSTNLFDGTAAGATDILVKFTYYGDTNLDGKVDGSDYSRLDSGYLNHLTGWFNGDFNYDEIINGSDYTLIDNAYNSQGASLAAEAAPTAAVMAPAGVRVIAVDPSHETLTMTDRIAKPASIISGLEVVVTAVRAKRKEPDAPTAASPFDGSGDFVVPMRQNVDILQCSSCELDRQRLSDPAEWTLITQA